MLCFSHGIPDRDDETQPGRVREGAAATHASSAEQLATDAIICRGGGGLLLERIQTQASLPQQPGEDAQYQLIFGTVTGVVGADGRGLQASTCGFAGRAWTPGDPPAVRFYSSPSGPFFYGRPAPGAEAGVTRRPLHLDRPDHYWRFVVSPAHGYYEVAAHDVLEPSFSAATGARAQKKIAVPATGTPGRSVLPPAAKLPPQ